MANTSLTWKPKTFVILAAVVIFVLAGAGVEIGDSINETVAWGLAVFAAAFLL